jgi:hypothetical protein
MKDETEYFPEGKCYVFSQISDFYCASYERVRIPSSEELAAMLK